MFDWVLNTPVEFLLTILNRCLSSEKSLVLIDQKLRFCTVSSDTHDEAPAGSNTNFRQPSFS